MASLYNPDDLEDGEVVEETYESDAAPSVGTTSTARRTANLSSPTERLHVDGGQLTLGAQTGGSNGALVPPTATVTPTPNAGVSLEKAVPEARKKAESLTNLNALREKLIAQRNNGQPVKSDSEPPSYSKPPVCQAPTPPKLLDRVPPADDGAKLAEAAKILGLEKLIAEERAAAEAKSAEQSFPSPTSLRDSHPSPVKYDQSHNCESFRSDRRAAQDKPPDELSAQYYQDLPAWLEMTGFYNANLRAHRLRAHRERQSLMEEAARMAAKLERLKQEEDAALRSLPAGSAHPTAAEVRAPPLPTLLPVDGPAKPKSNPAKRDRSPGAPWSDRPATRARYGGHARPGTGPQASFNDTAQYGGGGSSRPSPGACRQPKSGQKRYTVGGRGSDGYSKW